MKMKQQTMQKNYSDVSLPGSLSGLQNFYRALESRVKKKVHKKDVKDWLITQDAYSLHKIARKKFKRNKVNVNGIDDLWQIDLADLSQFTRQNKGTRYLLTCIDVFSKYAWVQPIANKKAETVLDAFKNIIAEGRIPIRLQADKGTEFINKDFKQYLKNQNIFFYSVNSELKASVVERFNRTVKEKIYRYFTLKNTYKYIDVLDKIVSAYNKSFNRTIKMSPTDVTIDNQMQIYDNVYNDVFYKRVINKKRFISNEFVIGNHVRISKHKGIFEKGYTPNWTEEFFKIVQIIPRDPVVYKLEDMNGHEVEGIFYKDEIQKYIKADDYFHIKNVIRHREKAGKKEFYVSWIGYPSTFNSWIKEEDLKRLK